VEPQLLAPTSTQLYEQLKKLFPWRKRPPLKQNYSKTTQGHYAEGPVVALNPRLSWRFGTDLCCWWSQKPLLPLPLSYAEKSFYYVPSKCSTKSITLSRQILVFLFFKSFAHLFPPSRNGTWWRLLQIMSSKLCGQVRPNIPSERTF
jgi:hypothetical protein